MKSKILLIEYIKRFGAVKGNIVRVDYFLNHRVDPFLLSAIVEDFMEFLKGTFFDQIITVESSGIPLAAALSLKTGKPFIFIKKKLPVTMNDYYFVESYSFTKQTKTELYLSKAVVKEGENVVFIDDFYANGATFDAVKKFALLGKFNITKALVAINKAENENILSIINKKELESLSNEN
jgi:xanthine phosphoribosyltransferase